MAVAVASGTVLSPALNRMSGQEQKQRPDQLPRQVSAGDPVAPEQRRQRRREHEMKEEPRPNDLGDRIAEIGE